MISGTLRNLSREREVHVKKYTQLTLEGRYHISALSKERFTKAEIVKGIKERFITMTVDTGREFAGLKEISLRLGVDVDFTHPYQSWERGLNENTYELIRQYFYKKVKSSKDLECTCDALA